MKNQNLDRLKQFQYKHAEIEKIRRMKRKKRTENATTSEY